MDYRGKRRRNESDSKHNYKRRRSRSRSPSTSTKSRPDLYKDKKIGDYKYELARFLEEQSGITNPKDFWTFYDKYQAVQASKNLTSTETKLLNIHFIEPVKALYDKLPVLDKRGERVRISPRRLRQFPVNDTDFQQKTSFAKLKKLKTAQGDLPIAQHRNDIIEKLKEARVMLIAGDTGCGKSTQVPQYVLEAGYNKIVCTQPRRIACVSLAKRVAYETLTEYKNTVGYQIRFEKTKRADTKIVFMTEGLLLRQASEQETLNSYDVIILDEVHERHLYGDFLIGIMKCLLHKRDDFKLILMSATINLQLFTDYFAEENVQVIEVPGRLYPIEMHYRPIIKDPFREKKGQIRL
ncbi:hypothetical protein NQ317_002151 [Molorchus minor]|uniref:Helicase ATP-binding domain-containing protein n=1 Tax=Molorchus minor TaxID=1323400 RepID=A0ABQ9JWA8_9CUCU|nr:hypothetical protein NQ317_002151 [Molorchus minor]